MVKHTTQLIQRGSPLTPTAHRVRFTTRPTQHQKAPFIARSPINARSPGLRSRLHSTNTNRFLSSRTQLSTICEDPEEDDVQHRLDETRDPYPPLETWARGDARPSTSRRHGQDDDVDMHGWDDETTLVAMFQDDPSDEDEEEQLMALVEQLQGPMTAQGAELKKYLKDALLPAYNSVRATHGELDQKVDVAFGAGLLTFDEVCKKVERIALRDEDELKTAHSDAQRNIAKTLGDLQRAYDRRKELWHSLEDDVDRCATRASDALEALSTDVEQAIALLEKKSKALDKESVVSSNQKMLRGLLEKL